MNAQHMQQAKPDLVQKYGLPIAIVFGYLVGIPIATYATYRGFYHLDGDAIRLSIFSIGLLGGLTGGILSYLYGSD